MEWEFTLHKEQKYVELLTYGTADADSSLEMVEEIKNFMRSNRITRILIDHRNLESVSGKVVDIYNRPKIFRMIGILLGVRIAEVVRPEHLEHFKFLETVSINNGFKFSVFLVREKAVEWLLF